MDVSLVTSLQYHENNDCFSQSRTFCKFVFDFHIHPINLTRLKSAQLLFKFCPTMYKLCPAWLGTCKIMNDRGNSLLQIKESSHRTDTTFNLIFNFYHFLS